MFQASLLDDDTEERGPRPLSSARRTPLAHGAWVDHLPSLIPGADALFERLHASVPWRAARRRMYDRVVGVPRLLGSREGNGHRRGPVLKQAKEALGARYAGDLGAPCRTLGRCVDRDGRVSAAWHGDRIGRGSKADTIVPIH